MVNGLIYEFNQPKKITEKRAASSFLTYKLIIEETVPGRAAGEYGAKNASEGTERRKP